MEHDEVYEGIRAELVDDGDDTVRLADGLEPALIGIAEVWTCQARRRVALYDAERCLQLLEAGGMDTDEAAEYLESQVLGAYVGEGTPVFAVVYRPPVLGELLG